MLLFELCVNQAKTGQLFFFSMKYHFLLTARETSGFRRLFFCLFLFACFWLCWVFVAMHDLSQVLGSGACSSHGVQTSYQSGFSC